MPVIISVLYEKIQNKQGPVKPGGMGGAEGQCNPRPPRRPSLMQSKNSFVEIIQFLFYFLTKSI